MGKSTTKPTYKELERSLRKAEKRAKKAEGSLKELNNEKAVLKRKIKKLESSKNAQNSKKIMFDSGTDRIYTEKVERHTHPSYTILAGLMLFMYAKCSYRQVVMEVKCQTFSPVLPCIFEALPCHATIED